MEAGDFRDDGDDVVPAGGVHAQLLGRPDALEEVPLAAVVGGQGEFQAFHRIGPVLREHPGQVGQVFRADGHVHRRVQQGVHAVALVADLHQAHGAAVGAGLVDELGFVVDDRAEEAPVPAVLVRILLDDVVIGADGGEARAHAAPVVPVHLPDAAVPVHHPDPGVEAPGFGVPVVPEDPDGAVAEGDRADEPVGVETVRPVHHQQVHRPLQEGVQVVCGVGRGDELEPQPVVVGELPEDDLVHADGQPADGLAFQVDDATERLRGVFQGQLPRSQGHQECHRGQERGNQQIFPEGVAHGIVSFFRPSCRPSCRRGHRHGRLRRLHRRRSCRRRPVRTSSAGCRVSGRTAR